MQTYTLLILKVSLESNFFLVASNQHSHQPDSIFLALFKNLWFKPSKDQIVDLAAKLKQHALTVPFFHT